MDTVQEIFHRVLPKQKGPSPILGLVRKIRHRLMLVKIHQRVSHKAAHSLAADDGEKSRHGGLHLSERTHFLAAETTGSRPTISHPWDPPGLTRAEQVDLRLRRAVDHAFSGVVHVQGNPCCMHMID